MARLTTGNKNKTYQYVARYKENEIAKTINTYIKETIEINISKITYNANGYITENIGEYCKSEVIDCITDHIFDEILEIQLNNEHINIEEQEATLMNTEAEAEYYTNDSLIIEIIRSELNDFLLNTTTKQNI